MVRGYTPSDRTRAMVPASLLARAFALLGCFVFTALIIDLARDFAIEDGDFKIFRQTQVPDDESHLPARPTAAPSANPTSRPNHPPPPLLHELVSSPLVPVNRSGVVVLVRGSNLRPGSPCAAQVDFVFGRKSRKVLSGAPCEVVGVTTVRVALPPAGIAAPTGSPIFPLFYGHNAETSMGGPARLSVIVGSEPPWSTSLLFYVASPGVTAERPLGGFEHNATWEDFSLAARFVARKFAVETPGECSRRKVVPFNMVQTGLGVVLVLQMGYVFRQVLHWNESQGPMPMVLPLQPVSERGGKSWNYDRACVANSSWECLFSTFSLCQTVFAANGTLRPALTMENLTYLSSVPQDRLESRSRSAGDAGDFLIVKCGLTCLYAAFIALVTQTRADLEPLFASKIKAMGGGPSFDYQCVAVHVRLGERGMRGSWGGPAGMARYSLQEVLLLVRPVARALGVRRVLMVTDGTNLMREIAAFNGSDLDLATTADVKHPIDGNDCLRELGCTKGLSPEEARFALLLDLEVLSKSCRYFVGTTRSTFTKLALLRGLGAGVIRHNGISFD